MMQKKCYNISCEIFLVKTSHNSMESGTEMKLRENKSAMNAIYLGALSCLPYLAVYFARNIDFSNFLCFRQISTCLIVQKYNIK